MKNSRFVQPRRPQTMDPSSILTAYNNSSREENEYIALVPTEVSTTSLSADGEPRDMVAPPTITKPHQMIDTSQNSSKQLSSGESNATSIEEVIIGLDHSFKASRWNRAHSGDASMAGSILLSATGSFGAEDDDDDKKYAFEDCSSQSVQFFEDISPNSVQSVTGVWDVRSKSGDSVGDDLRRANTLLTDGDDYSAITEVYNEWDANEDPHKTTSSTTTTGLPAFNGGSTLQPMLMSSSPTSEDGYDDPHHLLFPEVDHRKFRMLQQSTPPPPPSTSAFTKPSLLAKLHPTKTEIHWKLVAFWLAVIFCWLKLAAGLRLFGCPEESETHPPLPIELHRLVLGLYHEL